MANVHDDTTGAEQPGFLQKIKDTLHIGYGKEKEAAPTTAATPDAAVSNKNVADVPAAAAAPASHEESIVAKPSPPVEQEPATTDLSSLAGHEAEHHGGVPTFLAALPDEDIPAVVTKETATSDTQGGEFFDSEEVFSNAQQSAHHEGVPTFLVALPDQDLPDGETKEKLHHVTAEETTTKDLHHEDKGLDSEEVFSNAQQGEHHGGVPTFLVALPDQEIPEEVNKVVVSDVAGKQIDDSQQFDSEELFSKAQQGEHHEGVPTFMVALPDQDLPDGETKEKLHHVST